MAHHTPYSGNCRYIVADIDYTFVGHDKKLLPKNLEAVQKALQAGIKFAFATGRCMSALLPWCREMSLTAPQVADNGATIFNPQDQRILAVNAFTVEACHYWVEGFRDAGFPPIICTPEDYFGVNFDDDTRHMIELHGEHYTELPSWEELFGRYEKQIVKVTASTGLRAAELEEKAAVLLANARHRNLPFSATYTEKGILVVTAANVNKMSGIQLAVKQLGCRVEDVAAIGDGDNDADMLEGCGLGIAVANATPKAKEAATHVVGHCDNCGFAEAIELILSNRL